MKNQILAIIGATLMAFATAQFAAAAEQHHGRIHHRAYPEFRNSQAYVPANEAVPEAYRYGGGWSDMAGR